MMYKIVTLYKHSVENAGIFANGKHLKGLLYFSMTLMVVKISYGYSKDYDLVAKYF